MSLTYRRIAVLGLPLLGLAVALAAEPLPAGKDFTNSIGMKFVRIEPGEFIMGQGEAPPKTRDEWNERDYDESPAHPVKITTPYFLGITEVTNAQYEQFDPDHRKQRGKFSVGKADNEPVTMVNWQQAVDFCNWLSKKESKLYRLPTEAEWEYACRAGTTTPYHTGDKLTPEQANFGKTADNKRFDRPLAVGTFKPNAWGLHDMHGNVAEWCLDWYGPYEAGAQSDPVGRSDGWARVTRGWSYLSASHKLGAVRYARSANRSGQLPEDANRVTGFRVVLGELPATKPLPVAEPPLNQQQVKQTAASKEGPDPLKPYFADLTKGLSVSKDAWGPIYGAWNHYSTITVCPNGDVLAVWYTCTQEEGRECAQAASRMRAGTDKWDPPSFFFGTPDCNTHAPVLLADGKRLHHFFTQSFNGWDDAADCMRTSEDNGATWSKPRIILTREDPLRMSQPCSAFVAKNGKLVLAVDGDFGHRDERVMTSGDGGKTWTVGKGDLRKAAGKYAIHPAVVQRDNSSFLVFLRGPDPMPAFSSKDEGETWEPVNMPFPGIGVGQKAAALKLASGALLLCSFDNKKQLVGGGTFAALSFDDGKTWPHIRKVEGPGGYMSLAQGPNGVIYLLGPGGSFIRCASFNEAWLKEGKPLPVPAGKE
ncbi:MAG: SUMF1/EgtB/PvdO family nonheme iron enzyme [Planctomycetia bacterium]|nr:SUMF1/EgtB/PvdO family nonheme iron enzyme [Planctomycetia bacterium]